MGLITTFLFNKYLKDIDNKYKKNENKISIVVPKQNINKNQKVTKDMFQLKEFDLASVHPEAVKKVEDIVGSYALTDIKEGEVLFSSRFINQFHESELVTRKIREGFRAVSVEVNFVESVSNLIQPEDYVDVVFSEKVKMDANKIDANKIDANKEIVNTEILLQNVRVLAVGKRLVDNKTQSKDTKATDQKIADQKATESKDNLVEYISATLELEPKDTIKLINADERGNLKLTLRSQVSP